MLRIYKPIEHELCKVHYLIKELVFKVFCRADDTSVLDKIDYNDIMKTLYNNQRSVWFQEQVDKIYDVCCQLTSEEKLDFAKTFRNNNQIEYLCSHPDKLLKISSLNNSLQEVIIPFFGGLYDKVLEWKSIWNAFGSKKDYYDKLIRENDFKFCPCCGFGEIKTIYDCGHSPFDHYLALSHYPLSAVNFKNLFPLCHHCNSDYKKAKDILANNQKVFYPASKNHPDIIVNVNVEVNALSKVMIRRDRFLSGEITIELNSDQLYHEQIDSWNNIFSIKERYFSKVADNAIGWLNDVREKYRTNQMRGRSDTFEDAFSEVIGDDSNKSLGFLKSPYLEALKNNHHLISAMLETRNDSKINEDTSI